MPNRTGHHDLRLGKHLADLLSRTPEVRGGLEGAGRLEGRRPARTVHRHEDLERHAQDLMAGRAPRALAGNLEAIILPDLRPVIDIVDGAFGDPGGFFPELARNPTAIQQALASIGRINVIGVPGVPYVGTGFVVGDGVLMTNRHVAEVFTAGLGAAARLRFLTGVTPSVDLRQELGRDGVLLLTVVKPLLVHPYWDMALLQVKGIEGLRPLRLAVNQPAAAAAVPLAVVGYPAFDPRNEREVQLRMFRGAFGVKRLQPGYGKGLLETSSYGHQVVAYTHDCSTLGGNSGSCLLEVSSGQVLGLHFGGVYLDTNYAVPAWELARDGQVVDAGVVFGGPRPQGPLPWADAWTGLERPSAPARPGEERAPIDWYERTSPDDLRRAWQRDPDDLSARLERAIGPVDARAVRTRLSEGRAERLFPRRVDPDAREVLFLHGILGAHLDSADGRSWLDLERVLFGDLAGRLSLQPDGLTDAWPGPPAWPGPHLKLKYQRAADAWRDEGLVVHAFSYDWRKPVEVEAERLHAFVQALAHERPGKRLLLVAHSMGGLVSAAWAASHPEWKEHVEQAVLLGSPLRGSYAPFEAIRGTYPVFRKLALASTRNSLEELQGMARTLPGLIDMLPDPALFPDAERIYAGDAWQTSYAPDRDGLARSRALKARLASSPLLERAVALVAIGHGTVSSLDDALAGRRVAPGDGTVPIASAAPPGVPVFLVTREHSDLPRDPLAIAAVLRMARGGQPGLPELTAAQRLAPVPQAESIVAELGAYDLARGEVVARRVETATASGADLDWILSTGFDVPDRDEYPPGESAGKTPAVGPGAPGAAPATGEGPAFREFQLGGPLGVGDPVHETITVAALDAAGYPQAGRDQLLRGVFWNDDPEGLLFTDDPQRPLQKSTGFLFALRFKRFELVTSKRRAIVPADGLLARSHLGDLQYLHAMAATDAETPARTRQLVLGWAEFCWEVALGNILAVARREDWGPQAGMLPPGVKGPATVGELFGKVDGRLAPFRALGSLCHLIEDSFALGHVDRVALAGNRRGRIRRFFCYTTQDHAQHAAGDRWQGPGTPDQRIDALPGARDATECVSRLAGLYQRRAPWSEVKPWLADQVWALATSPTERPVARRRVARRAATAPKKPRTTTPRATKPRTTKPRTKKPRTTAPRTKKPRTTR